MGEKGREYIEKKFFSQDQVMSILLYANENYKQKYEALLVNYNELKEQFIKLQTSNLDLNF